MNGTAKTIFALALASIRFRPLQAGLCVLAIAAGIALLSGISLTSKAIQDGISANTKGIDLVVGPKGSALQLTLSTVYHLDIPPGNIPASAQTDIAKLPNVKSVIPLAMGDTYRGRRIIGTTPDFIALYGGTAATGEIILKKDYAVAGSNVGLKPGDSIVASHGFSTGSADVHEEEPMTVSAVLAPTGTVLDSLILTSVDTVQHMHHHEEHEEHTEHAHHDHENEAAEITALIVRTNPVGKINLPRTINENPYLSAANPALEMSHFFNRIGIGRSLIEGLSWGILLLSALMLFALLASGLAQRQYDLALLRVFGAGPWSLSCLVALEGAIIGLAGAVTGVFAGHVLSYAVLARYDEAMMLVSPASVFSISSADATYLLLGVIAGISAAALPAISARRADILGLLSRNGV